MNALYKTKQFSRALLIGLLPLVFTACTYNGEQNARLDAQDALLRDHEARLNAINMQVAALQASLTETATNIDTLSNQLDVLTSDQNSTQTQVDNLEALIEALQNQTIAMQTSIVTLQLQDGVVEYLDPCGQGSGYNEVLLKTTSGKVIAFFESGGNRFLTILVQNTNYRTTDADKCYFYIDSNGQLAGEHH